MKDWKDVDGWFDEPNETFYQDCLEKLPNKNEPKIFYEIGSWKGRSTCCMAQLIKKNNISAQLYAVDTFAGSGESIHTKEIARLSTHNLTLFEVFKNNINDCEVDDIVIPIVSTGCDAAKNVEDNTIDFLYLDASHDYESVKRDIETWLPKMKEGSIMTGDDYNSSWTGVICAVDEVFLKIGKTVDFGGYINGQWRVFL